MITYEALAQAAINGTLLVVAMIAIITTAVVVSYKMMEIAEREYNRARLRAHGRRMR